FGPMAVQARIAEIQSRFAPAQTVQTVQTAATTSRATGGTATGGAGSTLTTQRAGDFAAALARLNDLSAVEDPGSSSGAGAISSIAGQSDSAPGAGIVTGSQVVAD